MPDTTPITKKRSNDRRNLYRAINNSQLPHPIEGGACD